MIEIQIQKPRNRPDGHDIVVFQPLSRGRVKCFCVWLPAIFEKEKEMVKIISYALTQLQKKHVKNI